MDREATLQSAFQRLFYKKISSFCGPAKLKDRRCHAGVWEAVMFTRVTFLVAVINGVLVNQLPPLDPDVERNVSQLIASRGYPVQEYWVTTGDGYILGVQRIPHGKHDAHREPPENRPAVLVMHGLLSSSADWIIDYENQSAGYVLADAGYDVWLGNCRGNTYSKRHVSIAANLKKFWDFSFDQMIMFDIPAMVDLVLENVRHPKIFYIGHSQGALTMLGLLSSKPEYNEKIIFFAGLGPVTSLGNMISPIKSLVLATLNLKDVAHSVGFGEFLPSKRLSEVLAKSACRSDANREACSAMLFTLIGPDSSLTNKSRLEVYLNHSPAGTSFKNVVHFAQLIKYDNFCKFDYGRAKNTKLYKKPNPPCYHLENVRAPFAIFWGDGDWLSCRKDLDNMAARLKGSLVLDYRVPFHNFNHLDFLLGTRAKELLYDKIIELFQEYDRRGSVPASGTTVTPEGSNTATPSSGTSDTRPLVEAQTSATENGDYETGMGSSNTGSTRLATS